MNRARVRDYSSAERWLQGARTKDKNERTLYEPGVRLVRTSPTEISVVLKWWGFSSSNNRAITYRSDGVTILHYGARYQSVRRIYMEYVNNLTMVIRKGSLIISLPTDGCTPSKIGSCRTCKGVGNFARNCPGPSSCTDMICPVYAKARGYLEQAYALSFRDASRMDLYEKARRLSHSHGTCNHGKSNQHMAYKDRYDCYRCNGTGKVDYGNKKRGRVWSNGEDIGIDADGNYIEI